MTKLSSAAMALLLVSAAPAFAQESNWTGEASLAGSKTTGNTETTDIGLAVKLNRQGEVWSHKFDALADFGEADDVENKKRFALGYQIDRNLSDRLYVFGQGDWFNDEFGAFQDGYYLGTGLGYKVVLPEPLGWNVEAGLGYRSQTAQDTIDADTLLTVDGETENELALRLFSDFDYLLNDNVSLYNDTELTYASSDTYIWNEVGITAQMFGNLAARASFRVDHHTDVADGTEKTDTISRVGVVYTIK